MQPVNDDMDNLFRQAADGYPLNTSGANFDKVRPQEGAETNLPAEKEPRRRYWWLLLLLLVPSPFILRHYRIDPILQYSQTNKIYQAASQDDQNQLTVATTLDTNNEIPGKESVSNSKSKKNESVSHADQPTTQHPETVVAEKQPDNDVTVNRSKNSSGKQQIIKNKSQARDNQTNRQSSVVISEKDKRNRPVDASVLLLANRNKVNNKYNLSSGKKDNAATIEKLINSKDTDTIKQTHGGTRAGIADSTLQTVTSKQPADSSAVPEINKANENADKGTAKKLAENNNRSKPGIYIGIVAGPDFSAVKSKRVDGAGYNLGFVAGYYTGRHLAFETGVVWNYKRYYSEGKHVSTENLGLLSHTDILDLNGSCTLIEIPVNLRYHFNTKTNGNWYMGAGVSSYIMKKEDYKYESKRYGIEYYGYKDYSNSSKNWLSVLQLQVGYQIKFKRTGSLRIEPYAKLPLQGIGIGKLPLSSAGVNFGFTIPIH